MTKKVIPIHAAREASDEELVEACARGERAALGTLFDRHHDRVHAFLARATGAAAGDLDDLVQHTFETVARAAARFDGRAQARTWLYGIALNVARRRKRTEMRRRRLAAAFAQGPRDAGDLAAELAERELSRHLHEAILALPAKLREPMVLVYLEALPGPEAAAALGIRVDALWKRLYEGRVALRAALQGVEP